MKKILINTLVNLNIHSLMCDDSKYHHIHETGNGTWSETGNELFLYPRILESLKFI